MPTVVIADDSPTMRRIVTNVLEKEGYEVVAAVDGMDAVQTVFRVQPDAVVCDVQMPRLSGYVAVRLLKEDWSTADIPIILLTSLDAASDRYWGGQSGADRFLTKDFEAPQLASAVAEVMAAARVARGDRDRLRPDPVELSDTDVMEKTCDVLDRTLFQASVAGEVTAIAASVQGFEATVAAVLAAVGRVVDHHLAGVVLLDEGAAYLSVAHPVSRGHYQQFLVKSAEVLSAHTGTTIGPESLAAKVADPQGFLSSDDDPDDDLATYLSMPLRGHGGALIGVIALSSSYPEAFGDVHLTTLKLLEGPAALVIDNARLADHR